MTTPRLVLGSYLFLAAFAKAAAQTEAIEDLRPGDHLRVSATAPQMRNRVIRLGEIRDNYLISGAITAGGSTGDRSIHLADVTKLEVERRDRSIRRTVAGTVLGSIAGAYVMGTVFGAMASDGPESRTYNAIYSGWLLGLGVGGFAGGAIMGRGLAKWIPVSLAPRK
jgi:hypothetical protein